MPPQIRKILGKHYASKYRVRSSRSLAEVLTPLGATNVAFMRRRAAGTAGGNLANFA